MKLKRAKIPMCPECGSQCEWNGCVDSPVYACIACSTLHDLFSIHWGYHPSAEEGGERKRCGDSGIVASAIRDVAMEMSHCVYADSGLLQNWHARLIEALPTEERDKAVALAQQFRGELAR